MLMAIIYFNKFGLFMSVDVERMICEGIGEGASECVNEGKCVSEGKCEIGVCVYSVGSEV